MSFPCREAPLFAPVSFDIPVNGAGVMTKKSTNSKGECQNEVEHRKVHKAKGNLEEEQMERATLALVNTRSAHALLLQLCS
jgi:hypothetical protein